MINSRTDIKTAQSVRSQWSEYMKMSNRRKDNNRMHTVKKTTIKRKKKNKTTRKLPIPKDIGGKYTSTGYRLQDVVEVLPHGRTSSQQLCYLAKRFSIPNFRGVFMRDQLPKTPWYRERGIVNTDTWASGGVHWVAYIKNGNYVKFFDSKGGEQPPTELVLYLSKCRISINHNRYQEPGTVCCGQMCLLFLLNLIDKFMKSGLRI